VNNEFYADIKIFDDKKFGDLISAHSDYDGHILRLYKSYYNLHFINGETVKSAVKFYINPKDYRYVYCIYRDEIISYRITNFSRKETVDFPPNLRISIANYRQNLREIEKLREANHKIVNEYRR